MVNLQGFSVSQDREVAYYEKLKAAVLASEAERKFKQRVARQQLGLPDIEDERGVFAKISKSRRRWVDEQRAEMSASLARYDSDKERWSVTSKSVSSTKS